MADTRSLSCLTKQDYEDAFNDSKSQIRADTYCHAGVGVIASVKVPKVTPSDSSGSIMGTLAGFRDYFMLTALKLSLEKHICLDLCALPYNISKTVLTWLLSASRWKNWYG